MLNPIFLHNTYNGLFSFLFWENISREPGKQMLWFDNGIEVCNFSAGLVGRSIGNILEHELKPTLKFEVFIMAPCHFGYEEIISFPGSLLGNFP